MPVKAVQWTDLSAERPEPKRRAGQQKTAQKAFSPMGLLGEGVAVLPAALLPTAVLAGAAGVAALTDGDAFAAGIGRA